MRNIQADVEDKIMSDIKLNGGAELHRIVYASGERISSIWYKGAEVWSCSRINEAEMIHVWDEMHSND